MELKLREDDENVKKSNDKPVTGSSDDAGSNVSNFGMYDNEPIVISTVVEQPVSNEKKSNFDFMAILKWVIIVAVAVLGVKLIVNIVDPKATDVTNYVSMETEEVEKKLDVKLSENSNMKGQIHHYSDGEVIVYGDGEIGVVYMDGKHIGLHINNKKYSMYGVKIGDSQKNAEKHMTYQADNKYDVLNDMMAGNSTTVFYYNKSNDDCFAVIYNDNTNRAVAMTYFNNYHKISERLSGIADDE